MYKGTKFYCPERSEGTGDIFGVIIIFDLGTSNYAYAHVGWLVGCFLINVDLAIFQPYLDLEAGDNQSLKIQVARRGIEPRSS